MQSLTLPHLLIQSMTTHTITNSAIQQSITSQQSMLWHSDYKAYRVIIHDQGDRPPAAGGPPPMRTPGAARRTLNQLPKTMNFVLLYCFSIFPFVLLISTRRPISREDAHRMYPRYLLVFLFCRDLLPTPPPISVRKAGGITVVYLCGF